MPKLTLYTDTHCHLDFERFDLDREKVLKRAWEAGLVWILNPGIDLETNLAAIALAKVHPGKINAAVGIHPNYGRPWTADILPTLKEQALQPGVVALGEIGLDYYRQHTTKEQQKMMFIAQLRLAAELNLPIIIHNRDSTEDLLAILKDWHRELVEAKNPLSNHPGVLHSYTGDLESAKIALAMNFFIGISGPVTFRNAADRKLVTQMLPLDHLLLETDAPFLAPHPYRGKRNEPAYIPLIATEIAQLHKTTPQQIAEITYTNAKKLFNFHSEAKQGLP
jgi:TatD DNase family protein